MNAAASPVVTSQARERFGTQTAPAHALASAAPAGGGDLLVMVEKGRDSQGDYAVFRNGRGEVIRANLAPSDVTNQREQLETYLGGFQPFGFAQDMAMPPVLVEKEKGDRRDLGKQNAFEVVETQVGRLGAINQIDLISSLGTYQTREYGLASFLPWQTENDAQANFNVRASIGNMLQWKLALAREVRVWTLLTTLGSWATTNRLSITANYKWDNGATKNPRADLHAMMKAMLMPPTGIFMNPDVAFWMLSDAEMRSFMRQMLGDQAPSPGVAQGAAAGNMGVVSISIPGFPPIHICPGKKLNASDQAEYILGDDVVILSEPPGQPNDGLRMASALAYRTRGRSGTGVQTNEYIPQGRGLNSGTMFEVGFGEDLIVCSDVAGALLKDVLST